MQPVVTTDDLAAEEPAADRTRLVLVALIAVLVAPLAVGVVALRRPEWFPVLDHAMAELRLRDIFTRHTPLIGLPGRIGHFPEQGSHPGPLSFYSLWLPWKLTGSTPWGMQVGALVLNGVAAGASVLVAHRRGGLRLAVAVTALLAVLMGGYGIETLAEPWNPYIPLLWWVLALLCVWSAIEGDVVLLPVFVFAASIAAQTHVPYLGLCLGMGALVGGALVWRWRREPDERRGIVRWGAVALALTALLWSPLVVDQVTADETGNLTMLWRHFTSPPEEDGDPVGFGEGIELALRHLDVTSFLSTQGDSLGSLARSSGDAGGSVVPGVVTLLVWGGAAAVAWRRRWSVLNHLNVVVGAGLLLGAFSMSRIFGKVWYYLMLWSWGTAALLVLSVGWTAVKLLARPSWVRLGLGVLGAVAVISSILLGVQAAKADPPAPQLSEVLAHLVPATAEALSKDETYLVSWDDSFYIGSQGMGLESALDRLGFRVGVVDTWRVPLTRHRVIDPSAASEQIHLAVGSFVESWRRVGSARELASYDPRTPAQVEAYESLRAQVIDELTADGFDGLVPLVDCNVFGLSINEDIADSTKEAVEEMLGLGSPGAVFLAPVDAAVGPCGS